MTLLSAEHIGPTEFIADFQDVVDVHQLYSSDQRAAIAKLAPIADEVSEWRRSHGLGDDLDWLDKFFNDELDIRDLTPEQVTTLRLAAGHLWQEGVHPYVQRPLNKSVSSFEERYGLADQRRTGEAVGVLIAARRVALSDASRMRYKFNTAHSPTLTRRQPREVQGLMVGYNLPEQTITLEALDRRQRRRNIPQFTYVVPILSPNLVRIESVSMI